LIHSERIRPLNNNAVYDKKFVLYWMQASARAGYNHALEYAIKKANELKKTLIVIFALTPGFPGANARHYHFMLEGLFETRNALLKRGIKMAIVIGNPPDIAASASKEACLAITDMGYLKIQRLWRREAAEKIKCAFIQVESDVIVPVETASNKEEFAARTIRPKITRLLEKFLAPLNETRLDLRSAGSNIKDKEYSNIFKNAGEEIIPCPSGDHGTGAIIKNLGADPSVKPSSFYRGGAAAALKLLEEFIENKLDDYAGLRNDPSLGFLSNMSPYLHFGQISPLYIALKVKESQKKKTAADVYLEEIIVRRELSMNFCHYNDNYDSFEGLPEWVLKNFRERENDRREYIYTSEEFEKAMTHDHYWNAAQLEMAATGKMHNYMRMYWGKKIIEWSENPREAFKTAIYLNNRYELDGRDPNGFAGVAWCFGKHDRPWTKRPIFGSVRYMNENGLRRKFDIESYVKKTAELCRAEGVELPSLTHLMEKNHGGRNPEEI